MHSVIVRNVVMRRIPVFTRALHSKCLVNGPIYFIYPNNEVYEHWAQIFHSTHQLAVNERQVCEYTRIRRHSLNWQQHSLFCWNPSLFIGRNFLFQMLIF
jgi:hypothetical protein